MDIRAYLRDMDREENELRAEIMRLQVRIAQLHDTRIVMMNREEERARRLGQPSPFGAVPGGEIVIKDPQLMLARSEAGELSQAAKAGMKPGQTHRWIEIAYEVLVKAQRPLTPAQIRDEAAIDDVDPATAIKRFSGSLNALKRGGYIHRLPGGGYQPTGKPYSRAKAASRQRLPEPQPRPAGPKAKGQRGYLRRAVEQLLADNGPLTTAQIVKALVPEKGAKKEMDRVYGALFGIRRAADDPVEFDGEVYRLRQRSARAA